MASNSVSRFGAAARKEFLFAQDYVNLNHGSFGTYPSLIRDELRRFQDDVEARPDVFIRYDYPQLLDAARDSIAGLLNVDVGEVVFVPNATTAMNTVLRNLVFRPGDVIVYFATIYGACEKTVSYITETTPAQACKISFTYPISDSVLVSKLESTIISLRAKGKNPRIAIFDTVVSLPGVRMPYEDLTAVCKRENVLSCIDAAHAVGMLTTKELDLRRLQPDFFFSNCHKWLFVPRGCAVLYVPLKHQHLMRSTLPTSHGFTPLPDPDLPPAINPLPPNSKSSYVANFEFVGTIDNAPYLCLPRAIKYRAERFGGEDAIAAYLRALARRGGATVAAALGTVVMENEEGTLQECAFSNVRLAIDLTHVLAMAGIDDAREDSSNKIHSNGEINALGWRVCNWIARTLAKEYGTFVNLLFYDGAWWGRLSAQVYLEDADFERAGQVLKEVCARVEKGEFLQDKSKM